MNDTSNPNVHPRSGTTPQPYDLYTQSADSLTRSASHLSNLASGTEGVLRSNEGVREELKGVRNDLRVLLDRMFEFGTKKNWDDYEEMGQRIVGAVEGMAEELVDQIGAARTGFYEGIVEETRTVVRDTADFDYGDGVRGRVAGNLRATPGIGSNVPRQTIAERRGLPDRPSMRSNAGAGGGRPPSGGGISSNVPPYDDGGPEDAPTMEATEPDPDASRKDQMRAALVSEGAYVPKGGIYSKPDNSEDYIERLLAEERSGGRPKTPREIVSGQQKATLSSARDFAGNARGAGLGGLRRQAAQSLAGALDDWEPSSGMGRLSRSVLSGYANGQTMQGSVMGSLGPSALKFAGTAAGIYGAVNEIADFAEGQRESNRQYQSALGISNAAGFGQRAQAQLFRLSQFGSMSGAQTDQLFNSVTELGLSGDQRQQGLEFGAEAFRRFGMDIADSVRLIELASKRSDLSLSAVAESLEGVTTAARIAGVNADKLRDSYTNTLASVSQNYASGSQAIAVAEATTAFAAELGPGFEDVNLSGYVSEENIAMAASTTGQSIAELQVGLNTPGSTAIADVIAQGERVGEMYWKRDGMEAFVSQWLSSRGLSREGIGQNPAMLKALGDDIAKQFNLTTQEILPGLPPGVNPTQATTIMANMLVGGTPSENVRERLLERQRGLADPSGDFDFSQNRAYQDYIGSMTGSGGGVAGRSGSPEFRIDESRRSGVIEEIIASSPDDQRFVVRTSGGDEVVVDMDTAIKQYGEQLIGGEARFHGGQRSGRTTSEALGFAAGDISPEAYLGDRAAQAGTYENLTSGLSGAERTSAISEKEMEGAIGTYEEVRQKEMEELREQGVVFIAPTDELRGLLRAMDPLGNDLTVANAGGFTPGPRP